MRDTDLAVKTEVLKAVELERFIQSISNIAAYNNIDFDDYKALQFQVTELLKNTQQAKLRESFILLVEKYTWAQRPLWVLCTTIIGVE